MNPKANVCVKLNDRPVSNSNGFRLNMYIFPAKQIIHIAHSQHFTHLSVIFITLLTISFQSIRAAVANPVKDLKAE